MQTANYHLNGEVIYQSPTVKPREGEDILSSAVF